MARHRPLHPPLRRLPTPHPIRSLAPFFLALAAAVASLHYQASAAVASASVASTASSPAASEAARVAAVHHLRDTIHTLPAAEAARRFARLRRRAGGPPPRQSKVDHFVVRSKRRDER
jgi:hypothetical protein